VKPEFGDAAIIVRRPKPISLRSDKPRRRS